MTYAEKELRPSGFKLEREERNGFGLAQRVILSRGRLKFQFDCVCPLYPNIKAMGCPLHHEGPGGSATVEEAKKIFKYRPAARSVIVEIESGSTLHDCPARVLVYRGDKLVVEVEAKIEIKHDPKGGYFNCVVLEQK